MTRKRNGNSVLRGEIGLVEGKGYFQRWDQLLTFQKLLRAANNGRKEEPEGWKDWAVVVDDLFGTRWWILTAQTTGTTPKTRGEMRQEKPRGEVKTGWTTWWKCRGGWTRRLDGEMSEGGRELG
ncbi:hypothetical protein ACO22_02779 [Paracoccidioides brasiliensis]|uniref:Uncharacterized protein n=1 Tax=Paracoccidioides brasiliensis TaxID=121759 RepID=A0A1D2JHP6_PARBR|nr:hypothetical protein ACO22_02779 [Paracoccidioides brasiliensis]